MKKKFKKLEKRVELLESIINATQDKVVIIKEDKVVENKPTFKPVFMKCTQEQFDRMRPKLESVGCKFIHIDFQGDRYIVNNHACNTNSLSTVGKKNSKLHNRTEVHTEAEFLEACGYVEYQPKIHLDKTKKYNLSDLNDEQIEIIHNYLKNSNYKNWGYEWLSYFKKAIRSNRYGLIFNNNDWCFNIDINKSDTNAIELFSEKPIEEEQKTVRISDLPVSNIEELHAEHKEANACYEIWKDVIGYEGLYQVSSNGDIRNIKYVKNTTILNPSLETRPNKEQSLKVTLYDINGASKTFQLKKLVFCAFSKADINKRQNIYHIDKNPLNCNYSNLFTGDDFSNIYKYYFKDKQEVKREPKVGDVVKAWDDDKDKFVYGVLYEEFGLYHNVGEERFKNIELVTEININDFKREQN